MKLRFTLAALLIALPLGAQTQHYTASAGTPPQVAVRSIAAGPRPGTIPSGAYVLQPSGALGGAFAGNVYGRPLGGGIVVNGPGGPPVPGYGPGHRGNGQGPGQAYGQVRGVAFASYVPQYVEVPVEVPVAAPQQPIIINQYFTAPAPQPAPQVAPAVAARPVTPGDLLAPPENYYLIAYRNRSMYAAISWWMEGDTLHYVTTQNTHNQTSLDLIDLERTTKLNQDRNVPFAIAGR